MKIKLNEDILEVEENTNLSTFIKQQQLKTEGMAVAINYKVIPRTDWENTVLTDGQELIVIHAVAGG